jgi:hypothetical protein
MKMHKFLMALIISAPLLAHASSSDTKALDARISQVEDTLKKITSKSSWYCEVPCSYNGVSILPNGVGKGKDPASAVKNAEKDCVGHANGEAGNIEDLSKACINY